MRKVASTGSLSREAKGLDATAATGRQTSLRRNGSNNAVAALKPGRKASSDQDLCRLGGQPAFRSGSLPSGTARKSTITASAMPYYDPIPPAELAEDVLEASFARGLASAECFELYGPIRAAPQLTGAEPGDDAAHWSSQAATSQQLAACLATPFTGQDQNLGEIVRSEVDKLTADQELKTQLRYAEELRMRRASENEEEEEEEQSADQALGRPRRVRMRRRPSEEIMDAQLADIGVAGGKPIAGSGGSKKDPALAHSPETAAVLQTLYSSLDDDSNRLTLDEEALAQSVRTPNEPDIFQMDINRTRAPSSAKQGNRRAFINVTARAAPSLAGT